MHFSTQNLPTLDLYRLLSGGVVPRPIAWVGTRSSAGTDNLAPFSLFTIASVQPPVLAITHLKPANRTHKDTLANLLQTKDCVISIPTAAQLDAMNASAAEYPPDVSEFAAAGIASVASQQVAALGVQGAAVRYECRLREVLTLSDKPLGGCLILLDVLGVDVDESVLHEGAIAPRKLEALGKLGGDLYCTTTDRLERTRPPAPTSAPTPAK